MPLPVDIDVTYGDDPEHPGRKAHQQHHDKLHDQYNRLETFDPAVAGGTHPDLAAHSALGLVTQAELDTHVAAAGHTHPDLMSHDALGLATQAELDAAVALLQLSSEKAQPSGYASLDAGGKIPTGQLPSLAITAVYVVADEAAMLALDAQQGDVAIRTDFTPRRAFILGTSDPTVVGNWEALDPATVVTSVNGATGDVTDVVFTTDPRLSDSRTPTGTAGGVLSGTYPNPDFATDMATQAELDAVATTVIHNTRTASYTLVLTDAGKMVEQNVASANTLTVPPNSSVAFPIGTVIGWRQYGAGQVTLTPGSGVTIRSSGGKLKSGAQYAEGSLTKRAQDEWVASGDLVV